MLTCITRVNCMLCVHAACSWTALCSIPTANRTSVTSKSTGAIRFGPDRPAHSSTASQRRTVGYQSVICIYPVTPGLSRCVSGQAPCFKCAHRRSLAAVLQRELSTNNRCAAGMVYMHEPTLCLCKRLGEDA